MHAVINVNLKKSLFLKEQLFQIPASVESLELHGNLLVINKLPSIKFSPIGEHYSEQQY